MESKKEATHPKYIAKLEVSVNGAVETSDVIGAIFGQLEGLLGPELELKDLQRTGKIGRINIKLRREGEGSKGIVELYSGLDKVRTALLVAAMETIDKVGPYQANFKLIKIVDEREERRNDIARRAAEILKNWSIEKEDSFRRLIEFVERESAKSNFILYGEEQLPAGRGIEEASEIIVVEGRADVMNLLKYGFDNVIAMGGALERVPKSLEKLIEEKEAIAFVDGDRGGEMVLRTLLEQTDIDYVARAPEGKVVEELTAKEIRKALSSAVPADEVRRELGISPPKAKPFVEPEAHETRPAREINERIIRVPEVFRGFYERVMNTDKVLLLDEDFRILKETSVAELLNELNETRGVRYIIYDRIVTQRIVDKAYEIGVKAIVGNVAKDIVRKGAGLAIYTIQ
ncbi:DNA primase [Candidatus Korarchaeum cryptofilum]|jgi:DNA primase|uniref:DNA primase DnaG n=2 Tax=Candidatus Korarchaeum cryptofilum TaxID=498846 RepID=B1L658_KORCO|nr:DNA primase DnaG [Candidatus Korarchaeum cryptofilum]ACB07937.1 TOPRIM domain protein [Candidatus Korarchaeum cryptofilum OPF8]RSN69586.1 DNA primase [Candidatus Korarchaeum cryptofilum]